MICVSYVHTIFFYLYLCYIWQKQQNKLDLLEPIFALVFVDDQHLILIECWSHHHNWKTKTKKNGFFFLLHSFTIYYYNRSFCVWWESFFVFWSVGCLVNTHMIIDSKKVPNFWLLLLDSHHHHHHHYCYIVELCIFFRFQFEL